MKTIISCIAVLLLSVGCAGSAASKTESDSRSNSFDASISDLNSNDSSSTNKDRDKSLQESKEGAINQSEERKTDGKATGESSSSVKRIIEYIDPETGKVIKKETFELDSESSTDAKRNATDTRDQDGSFSGIKSSKESSSKSLEETSGDKISSSISSEVSKENKSKLEAKSSSGMSIWFWIILGLLGALAVVLFIFSRSLLGRLTRLTSYLATADLSKTDSNQYNSALNFRDRELIRRRRLD